MGQTVIGIKPTQVALAADIANYGSPYNFGDIGGYDDPLLGHQEFVWGRANGAVTGAGYVCVETTGFDFQLISITATTPGTAGPGSRVGVAMAALADNDAGWFQIYGKGTARTLGLAAKGTRLNTTGTNGCLDDDGTAGSEQVFGIVLGTATGGVTANNSDAILTYPSVGVTL